MIIGILALLGGLTSAHALTLSDIENKKISEIALIGEEQADGILVLIAEHRLSMEASAATLSDIENKIVWPAGCSGYTLPETLQIIAEKYGLKVGGTASAPSLALTKKAPADVTRIVSQVSAALPHWLTAQSALQESLDELVVLEQKLAALEPDLPELGDALEATGALLDWGEVVEAYLSERLWLLS